MSLSSVALATTAPHQLGSGRKRTSSFSYPPSPPNKSLKTTSMPLSRTSSFIIHDSTTSTTLAHNRHLSYHRDQHRSKRKIILNKSTTIFSTSTTTRTTFAQSALSSSLVPIPIPPPRKLKQTNPFSIHPSTISSSPSSSSSTSSNSSLSSSSAIVYQPPKKIQRAPQVILPSASCPITTRVTHRTSSPLSPEPPKATKPRPVFPRSKQEPDLYKTALKGCLKQSPDGQRVLHMGARLAMSIFVATRELERMVASETFRDLEGDVMMGDAWDEGQGYHQQSVYSSAAQPVLTNSWVVVKGDDWEMVDCAA